MIYGQRNYSSFNLDIWYMNRRNHSLFNLDIWYMNRRNHSLFNLDIWYNYGQRNHSLFNLDKWYMDRQNHSLLNLDIWTDESFIIESWHMIYEQRNHSLLSLDIWYMDKKHSLLNLPRNADTTHWSFVVVAQCRATACDIGPALNQCWATDCDIGPALNHNKIAMICFLGHCVTISTRQTTHVTYYISLQQCMVDTVTFLTTTMDTMLGQC